jgi:hypothetical protein
MNLLFEDSGHAAHRRKVATKAAPGGAAFVAKG